MPWRGPCFRLMGWRAGIPHRGRQGGEGKDARDVTATSVAGADLAYRPFISFPEQVYFLFINGTKWNSRLSAKGLDIRR